MQTKSYLYQKGDKTIDSGAFKAIQLLTKGKKSSQRGSIFGNNFGFNQGLKKENKSQTVLNYLNKDTNHLEDEEEDENKNKNSEQGKIQLKEAQNINNKEFCKKGKSQLPVTSKIREYIQTQKIREKNHKKYLESKINPEESQLFRYMEYCKKQEQQQKNDLNIDTNLTPQNQQNKIQKLQQQNKYFVSEKFSNIQQIDKQNINININRTDQFLENQKLEINKLKQAQINSSALNKKINVKGQIKPSKSLKNSRENLLKQNHEIKKKQNNE
ncbi:hypothetical protein PPERSA_09931 [Pseudocohnilembus persalinus]|uniref:Uncharacterized protein n=1 Tax=Pseudocohnilembus persalinus TaxID=266149 RepID=A0A0V0QJR0_PSEPJ|nr:hypothetical protein PPERSA_09931 [Pseudocohnilembus persalinus]|eukprot:KRX02314.1 hypothetical protein PPERSA_09931 [Pseudocohnilembus persalinus]